MIRHGYFVICPVVTCGNDAKRAKQTRTGVSRRLVKLAGETPNVVQEGIPKILVSCTECHSRKHMENDGITLARGSSSRRDPLSIGSNPTKARPPREKLTPKTATQKPAPGLSEISNLVQEGILFHRRTEVMKEFRKGLFCFSRLGKQSEAPLGLEPRGGVLGKEPPLFPPPISASPSLQLQPPP